MTELAGLPILRDYIAMTTGKEQPRFRRLDFISVPCATRRINVGIILQSVGEIFFSPRSFWNLVCMYVAILNLQEQCEYMHALI